jgi:hypothetical protein
MRDYVTAFFHLHLRGIPQHLLDGPTPGNPEVVYYEPGQGPCGAHPGQGVGSAG